jgi:nuclear cap-binding protein subunit 1
VFFLIIPRYTVEDALKVVPDPTTPAGYAIKSTMLDIIDIYEVNRKEAARILLEYAKWTPEGTFKPQPNAPAGAHVPDPVPGKDWQLESTVIEVNFSFFCLVDRQD